MAGNRKQKGLWKAFIQFYTRFAIPWWLYILSFLSAILYTELGIRLLTYNIRLNTGELYNSTLIGFAGLTLLMSLVVVLTNMTSAYASGRVVLRARNEVWRRILRLPMAEFDRQGPSKLISRVTADASQASQTMQTLSALISSVYSLARTFMVLYRYNAAVTRWLLLAIPLAVVNFWICGRTQYVSYRKMYEGSNRMISFFSEHIGAMKNTKAQATEELERQAGFRTIEARFRADVFNAFMVSVQVTSNAIYTNLCMLMLVFCGKREIEAGRLESTGVNKAYTYEHGHNVELQKY